MENNPTSIIKNLQLVFIISSVLLVLSLFSSLYSIHEMSESSKLVNHTNEVLISAEDILASVKNGETNQRGYLLTGDPLFLNSYELSYKRALRALTLVKGLTVDNSVQQKNLEEAKSFIILRFEKMKQIIDLTKTHPYFTKNDSLERYREIMNGRQIMDNFKTVVERIKNEETRLLQLRIREQKKYISNTPVFVTISALISILITLFSYIKIKRDVEERAKKQKEDEEKYLETSRRINVMESITKKIASGDYEVRSADIREDDLGRIGKALNDMTGALENNFKILENKNWLQSGIVKISDAIRGERDICVLSTNLIRCVTNFLKAPVATMYINSTESFTLTASYAISNAPKKFTFGEGLIGQAATNKQLSIVENLPSDFLITSSLGKSQPSSIVLLPLVYEEETIGIIEIGFLRSPEPIEIEFLESSSEIMAIGVNAALSYARLQGLLEETQSQTEELQSQHSELENLNTELEAQSQKLQASEEELRVQQEELQQTNEELRERTVLLEEKNFEVLKKAEELEITTRYKSEFLANMSHELRTPLNSILLLSRLLSENNEKNLSSEQVEYASVIQNSGRGLLSLIDEILDLSKIEAGKMELEYFDVSLASIRDDMNDLFKPVAREKNLDWKITLAEKLPATIETDKSRLEQILKNLISNALKFTSKGAVSLEIKKCPTNEALICFVVKDSGIGIANDKLELIFDAFKQADGSTRRKYGGTGLGLSISRELTYLLGGDIQVSSVVNKGSEFILRVPILQPTVKDFDKTDNTPVEEKLTHATAKGEMEKYVSTTIPEDVPDDRNGISMNDKVILIAEDDTPFAKSILDITRKTGYKGIVAVRGDQALALALKHKPRGILLDIQLPVKSGWEVIDELKKDAATRHIPVYIMSSYQVKNESLIKGAVGFISKAMVLDQIPEILKKIEFVLNRHVKKVLIIEDNTKHAKALAYYLANFNINSEVQSTVSASVDILKNKDVDCVIMDMGIPDPKSYKLLEEAKNKGGLDKIPIIIFTGKSLSLAEELRIKQYSDSIVVKTAQSYQRMLDEVSLFLHLMQTDKNPMDADDPKKIKSINEMFDGKTILVVDDDVRNIFSLSKSLENLKMNVITALNGKEALKKLQQHEDVQIVLLDMMMPEMDGYTTVKKIRENPILKNLPVIAVTARAMAGDREKCISAGASDFITKPVDVDQLLSLLRVWLYETYK